ncbi:hypothetical protein PCO31110_02636 [Pandoraea communis]|uniref:Uncharacterized protein n=1 Tax=Pandoraea communis TaxID=2508297 RepID=A0A5E4VEX2_9BURK|nr:hypothetical protein PCO31110_02636 [Pandoraea communis]
MGNRLKPPVGHAFAGFCWVAATAAEDAADTRYRQDFRDILTLASALSRGALARGLEKQ